jgi:hypothetical protein
MRFVIPALVSLIVLPTELPGQVRFTAAFGATAGTHLVEDRIFQDISVGQAIAPTVSLGATLPVSAHERAGLEVALGFGRSRIRETGLPQTDGPAFRALSVTGGVEGPILSRLGYRGGAGVLKYLPDKEGIFRAGGPLLLLLTGGLDYRFPMRGGLGLVARLRYDYQRFSTAELEAAGFARAQDVHRLGLGLGIEYQYP